MLVCAPSNIAVDQLAERISRTGLKVVRVAARSREDISTTVEHLTLHYQVGHLSLPDRPEYAILRDKRARGEDLTAAEGRKLNVLKRQLEKEVLQAADVICCTCVGAGDPRLHGLTFTKVCFVMMSVM